MACCGGFSLALWVHTSVLLLVCCFVVLVVEDEFFILPEGSGWFPMQWCPTTTRYAVPPRSVFLGRVVTTD